MRCLLASWLVGMAGCASAPTPAQPPPVAPHVAMPVEAASVAPETEPVRSMALPVWFQAVVHREGGASLTGDFPPQRTQLAAELTRCAVAWHHEDPSQLGALRVDLSIDAVGRVSGVQLRGSRPLAWPCLQRTLESILYDPPEGGSARVSLFLFFRPSSLSWGRSPALRPMFTPRARGDAPREPHEIAFDQDESDFLWSLDQLRARSADGPRPANALEQLLAGHPTIELQEPTTRSFQMALDAARRLAEQEANPSHRAAARLTLARLLQLRGDTLDSYRTLLSLVCSDMTALPSARSDTYWIHWWMMHPSRELLHPTPEVRRAWARVRESERRASGDRTPQPRDEPSSLDEETIYRDPFVSCSPAEGATKEMLAEAWWQIGNIHTTGHLPTMEEHHLGGPFALSRAASAHARSLLLRNDDVVRLQLALRHHQTQRYRAASTLLVSLLGPREHASGEDALIREVALTKLAQALLQTDFEGQPESEPGIFQSGPFTLSIDPDMELLVVPRKGQRPETHAPPPPPLGALGLGRVQDPALVPAGAWFTPELLLAMGQYLREFNYLDDAVRLLEHLLEAYPLHRDAPVGAAALVHLYQRKGLLARVDTPAHAEALRQQAAAAKRFEDDYVAADSPWSRAHQNDAAARARVQELARELAKGAR